MHEVFDWLRWREPDEARLAWLRAEDVRWKIIAGRYSMDCSTAWRRWTCALIKVASRLNGASATRTLQQNGLRQTGRFSVG